jgi:hypothetical protein
MQVLRFARRRLAYGLTFAVTAGATACVAKTYITHSANYPDELPPGVSSDPTVFRASVANRLPGVTHHYNRPGRNCGGCLVDVEIGPLGDTREVDPSPNSVPPQPATGRAVAKILNHDPSRTEDMYGLRPMSQREYYVWADTSGGNARFTLLSVPALGIMGNVEATFQKHLKICNDGHGPSKSSDAKFDDCPGVTLASNNSYVIASLAQGPFALLSAFRKLLTKRTLLTSPPIWLGCHSGCCG